MDIFGTLIETFALSAAGWLVIEFVNYSWSRGSGRRTGKPQAAEVTVEPASVVVSAADELQAVKAKLQIVKENLAAIKTELHAAEPEAVVEAPTVEAEEATAPTDPASTVEVPDDLEGLSDRELIAKAKARRLPQARGLRKDRVLSDRLRQTLRQAIQAA